MVLYSLLYRVLEMSREQALRLLSSFMCNLKTRLLLRIFKDWCGFSLTHLRLLAKTTPVSITTDCQQGDTTCCGPATSLYLGNPWGTRHGLNPVCRPGTAKSCIYPQTSLRAMALSDPPI